MSASFAQLRRHLSSIKPWVTVAVLLAVGLLGYYSVLGMRYWSASGQVVSLNSQIGQLSRTLQRTLPDEEALKVERESHQQRVEELRGLFSYAETDDLIAILSATAREAGVALQQVTVGESSPDTWGQVEYGTQPMTVALQGETASIYRFLSLLQQKVPVAAAEGISLASPGGSPLAQVKLLFYLSPELT